MHVDPRYELHYLRGDHEKWLQELLVLSLRDGDTYLDVGAHAGFFVLGVSRLIGAAGRIFAIEADPENYRRLTDNIAANRLGTVRTLNAAAWHSSGTVEFERADLESSRLTGRVVTHGEVAVPLPSVPSARLDDIVDFTPTVAKIDVEGAELEVFRGAERIIASRGTTWIVEVHDGLSSELVADRLRAAGYQVQSTLQAHTPYTHRQPFLVAHPMA